jgi:hypothetical protein
MMASQRHAAAVADPDARPMTDAEWARARPTGDERAWWKAVDPAKVARKLWKETRVDEGRLAPTPTMKPADRDRVSESDQPSAPAPAWTWFRFGQVGKARKAAAERRAEKLLPIIREIQAARAACRSWQSRH